MSNTDLAKEIQEEIEAKATAIADDWISLQKNPEEWERTYNSFISAAEYGYSLALSSLNGEVYVPVSVEERLPELGSEQIFVWEGKSANGSMIDTETLKWSGKEMGGCFIHLMPGLEWLEKITPQKDNGQGIKTTI
jgi:hypothetical protein